MISIDSMEKIRPSHVAVRLAGFDIAVVSDMCMEYDADLKKVPDLDDLYKPQCHRFCLP